jgi:hypothetical protein
MNAQPVELKKEAWPVLQNFPLPAKALASAIILVMAIGMAGALGQIIVHDIIPIFFSNRPAGDHAGHAEGGNARSNTPAETPASRGDLFSAAAPTEKTHGTKPFYKTEQFVWTLKWTHIHLFGMSMIFIFMGAIAVFLDLGVGLRSWLVVLPFVGLLIDIAAMWLKGYISPVFFWLHIPGGGLFGFVFLFVSSRALYEMWWMRKNYAPGRTDQK